MTEKTIKYVMEFDATQLGNELVSTNKKMQDLTATQKELKKNNQQNTKEFAKNAQELKETKTKYNDVSKAIQNTNKVRSKETGHLQKLKAQLSLVTRKIDGLSKEELENEKVGGKLIKTQKKLSDELSKTEEAGGNAHRSVGKYKEALEGLPGPIGKAASATKGFFATIMANPIGAIVAAISALVIGLYKYSQASLQAAKDTTKIAQSMGITRDEANGLRKDINALSAVWDVEFNDVVKSSSVLMHEFGISGSESLELIKDGFEKGANVNGEFLELLKEYPTQLKSVGLSASESIALITQTEQMGMFSDKGIDAIKEAGIRLRENTKATADALKVLDKQTQSEIKLAIAKGNTFKAIQLVSKGLKDMNLTAQESQTIVADVFGGPGEDAGMRFLTTITDINIELEDLPNKMSETEIASNELNESWSRLSDTLLEGGVIDNATNFIKNDFAKTLEQWNNILESNIAWWEKLYAVINPAAGALVSYNEIVNTSYDSMRNLTAEWSDENFTFEKKEQRLKELRKQYNALTVAVSQDLKISEKEQRALNNNLGAITQLIKAIEAEKIAREKLRIEEEKKAKAAADKKVGEDAEKKATEKRKKAAEKQAKAQAKALLDYEKFLIDEKSKLAERQIKEDLRINKDGLKTMLLVLKDAYNKGKITAAEYEAEKYNITSKSFQMELEGLEDTELKRKAVLTESFMFQKKQAKETIKDKTILDLKLKELAAKQKTARISIDDAIIKSRKSLNVKIAEIDIENAKREDKLNREGLEKDLVLLKQEEAALEESSKHKLVLLLNQVEVETELKIDAFKESNEYKKMSDEERIAWEINATQEAENKKAEIVRQSEEELQQFKFELAQETLQFAMDIMSLLKDTNSDYYNKLASYAKISSDNKLSNLSSQYDTEKKMLANKLEQQLLSEEEYTAALAKLDADYNTNVRNEKEATNDRLNQLKKEEFENSKKWQIAEIQMNAAAAIIGTWAGYAPQAQYGAVMA